MKIFSDFHHDDLFHSFHLLFEKRLGWELYAPVGSDWYTKGWWQYSTEPRVIDEYLVTGKKWRDCGDYSLMENPCHNRNLKALTFDQFKEMDIDIIISSVPEHEVIYWKLQKEFKPKAKLIQHWGNEWKDFESSFIKNWLVSCAPFKILPEINAVFYHQEFDLKLFNYEPSAPSKPIRSFVNDLPNLKDWKLFKRFEKELKRWDWKSHGLGCRDGNIRPLTSLVKQMKDSSFIFHAKHLGDGFGHIIHNIFALGRPALVRGKWYKGRLAEALIQDGKTCLDLDKHSFTENCERILAMAKSDVYYKFCERAKKRFDEVVNYDKEEKEIRKFLERLK